MVIISKTKHPYIYFDKWGCSPHAIIIKAAPNKGKHSTEEEHDTT